MSVRRHLCAAFLMAVSLFASHESVAQAKAGASPAIGSVVDQLNGIPVYFNGAIGHSNGRNITADGYNLGLRYQCVEFVKRYYYQRLGHRMPNASGNAVQYFDATVADGRINKARGLVQYQNGSSSAPQVEDILVFGPRRGNPYGHIVIVSAVGESSLEFIQQNPGAGGRSRQNLPLQRSESGVTVGHPRVLGWLRLPGRKPAPQSQPPAPAPIPVPTPVPVPIPPPAVVPPTAPPQETPVIEPVPQEIEIPAPDTTPVPEVVPPVPCEPPVNLPETPEAPSAKSP